MRVAGYFKADLLREEFHRIAIAQGFTPGIIEITGRNHTDKQDIAAIVNQMRGKSILAIDLIAMREDILQLGWVEDVVIIRTLPDKLDIRLSERQPVALLQSAKGHQLIDASGAVIHGANPADFNHLIVASGKGAAERAGMIIDILRTEPEIFSDVWAVQYISAKTLDIHMRSGLAIRLPERDPVLAGLGWPSWNRKPLLRRATWLPLICAFPAS